MSGKVEYEYTGAGWLLNLPARDLTMADLEATKERTGKGITELRELVEASGLYKRVESKGKSKGKSASDD